MSVRWDSAYSPFYFQDKLAEGSSGCSGKQSGFKRAPFEFSGFRLAFFIFFRRILVPGFHWPAQFDGERLTMTIPGLPSGYANPAFGNAIFLYIRADPVLEPNTDATLKLLHVEIGRAHV